MKVNLKTFNHISVFLHSNFGRKYSFFQPVVLNRTVMVRLFKSSFQMHWKVVCSHSLAMSYIRKTSKSERRKYQSAFFELVNVIFKTSDVLDNFQMRKQY